MSLVMISEKQRQLFYLLESEGYLLFSCGQLGVSADLNGHFSIRHRNGEDLLCLEDGTNHAHIDWNCLSIVELGISGRQGMLVFKDGNRELFRLFRKAGPFSPAVSDFAGSLLEEESLLEIF